MEALVPFCMLVGFFGFIVAIIAFAIAMQRRRTRTFQETAASLGLDAGRGTISGVRGGVGVRVIHTYVGSGKNRRAVTKYVATIDPPLRMGLRLSEKVPLFGGLAESLGLASNANIGDSQFDDKIRLAAIDPQHARAMLQGPAAAAVAAAGNRRGSFWGQDDSVGMQTAGHDARLDVVGGNVDACIGAVHALLEARRRVRAAWEPAVDSAWGSFAASNGLAYDPTRSVVWGMLGHSQLTVGVVVDRGNYWTNTRVQFPTPLGVGLRLVRPGMLSGLGSMLGLSQDIQVGDRTFDDAFVVKGTSPEAVRAVLNPEAVARINALHAKAAAVEADDGGLNVNVQGIISDEPTLRAMLDECTAAADAIRPPGLATAGVYR